MSPFGGGVRGFEGRRGEDRYEFAARPPTGCRRGNLTKCSHEDRVIKHLYYPCKGKSILLLSVAKREAMRYFVVTVIVLFTCCSTDVERFYKISRDTDLWVLPLIKPYRLVNAVPGEQLWYLDLKRPLGVYEGSDWKQVTVDSINVVNRVIYGSGYQPAYYFVIIPDRDVEKVFKNNAEWDVYLKGLNIDSKNLHPVLPTYEAFARNYSSLPWYTQVKNE
jgi:hypothetical protein